MPGSHAESLTFRGTADAECRFRKLGADDPWRLAACRRAHLRALRRTVADARHLHAWFYAGRDGPRRP